MKKTLIMASIAFSALMFAPVTSDLAAAETAAYAQGSTVPVYCFKGHMRIGNSATIESTDDGLVAYFDGKPYAVYSSDRDGYSYMFNTATTSWYFNL